MAIAAVNAASSTSSNWLKEAQQALIASQNLGGLLGALQNSKNDTGSIKSYLANSANNANGIAQINQNSQQAANNLTTQMAATAAQKRANDQAALLAKFFSAPTNYNPPAQLDPVIYFKDGGSIDTKNHILTMVDGTQIDTKTGQQVVDSKSIINMANGAYLDTKNHILTMANGTKIDTITGLVVTA